MFDMNSMMAKLREVQMEMEKTRQRLDDISVEAEAGGGMVRVTVNGNRKVMRVEIDPDIMSQDDREMVEDLVAAAVNKAMDRAEATAKEEMAKVTSGLVPPGMDLGMGLGGLK